MQDFLNLISAIVALIFAVTVHEYAHAWTADRLGDPTPRVFGRLTLNPLRHFDILGVLTFILSGFRFGWGKPVPFNAENLRSPRRDAALIACAGPLANLFTAFITAIPLKYLKGTAFSGLPFYNLIDALFFSSIWLLSLNILPFPPLDGSKIIGIFVPRRFHRAYDQYLKEGVKYFVIFILFDVFVLDQALHFSLLGRAIGEISQWIIAIIHLGT